MRKNFTCRGICWILIILLCCSMCGCQLKEDEREKESASSGITQKPETVKVNLFGLKAYSDKNVISGSGVQRLTHSNEEIDVDGWKHTDCYKLCGSEQDAYIRYELKGQYSKLTGNLYDSNSAGGAGWLEFYDGEKLIYTTERIGGSTTKTEFEFDISGVEFLTVYFRATESGTWMIADDIILSN